MDNVAQWADRPLKSVYVLQYEAVFTSTSLVCWHLYCAYSRWVIHIVGGWVGITWRYKFNYSPNIICMYGRDRRCSDTRTLSMLFHPQTLILYDLYTYWHDFTFFIIIFYLFRRCYTVNIIIFFTSFTWHSKCEKTISTLFVKLFTH